MQSRIALVLVAGALAVGLVACGGGSKSGATTNGGGAKPAVNTGAAEFGVPECDEFLNKYTACIEGKVPDAARAMVRQQLDATRASWKQAASTPEGKAALAASCKQMQESTKQAMAAYGCSW